MAKANFELAYSFTNIEGLQYITNWIGEGYDTKLG